MGVTHTPLDWLLLGNTRCKPTVHSVCMICSLRPVLNDLALL